MICRGQSKTDCINCIEYIVRECFHHETRRQLCIFFASYLRRILLCQRPNGTDFFGKLFLLWPDDFGGINNSYLIFLANICFKAAS